MMTETIWNEAPSPLVLRAGDVHVWRAMLDHGPQCREGLRGILSPDERERADRFHFARDAMRFCAGRAALRQILDRYTGRNAASLIFSYGPNGKPSLDGSAPEFNLAHADGLALLAVSRAGAVGIDVERIDGERMDAGRADGIAEQFFSPEEIAALRAAPVPLQNEAFFACWTRKEAYVKAKGGGLSLPLDRFAVTVTAPAALLWSADAPGDAERWRLASLTAAPGFAGALAVEAKDFTLSCWDWTWPCGCGPLAARA